MPKTLSTFQEYLLENDIALDIDVIGVPTDDPNVWELYGFVDGKEYLWGSTGEYACSIIYVEKTEQFFAAKDYRFKGIARPDFTCIWYR